MKKTLNIKSIILDNGIESTVETIQNKENGIKFYINDFVHDNFDILGGLRKTISLDKLKVRTLSDRIYTLFNCFYTVRGSDELYIHLIFNEIVQSNVSERNFKCNGLVIEFDKPVYPKIKEFSEDINFTIDGVTIKHKVNTVKYDISFISNELIDRDILFSYFSDYFEIINLINGYFPTIKKMRYIIDSKKIAVENELVSKYISSDEYRKNDLAFLNNISNDIFEQAYIKYREFSKSALLQLSMFFMSTMKKNSYVKINVVNLLQTLDGLYDKLTIFKNKIVDYCPEMNTEIIERIKTIDFSDIKEKYNSSIDINEKISSCIFRMNKISYRNKLKNIFEYDDYVIFKEEKNNTIPFIKYNSFVNKCVNSRNKFSHVADNNDYLFELENTTYIFKIILVIRLLLLDEIGLGKCIDKNLLNLHIELLNDYIRRVLK